MDQALEYVPVEYDEAGQATAVALDDLPAEVRAQVPAAAPDPLLDGVEVPDAPPSTLPPGDDYGMVALDDLPADARAKLAPQPVYIPPVDRAPAMDLSEVPMAALISAGLPVPRPRAAPPSPRPAPAPSPMDAMLAHRRRCARCGTATKKSQLCQSGLALYQATR